MSNKITTVALLAATIGLCAVSAYAADVGPRAAPTAGSQTAGASNAMRARLLQPIRKAEAGGITPKVEGTDTGGTLYQTNPKRAYPPSCLASPLPNAASGLVYTIHDFNIGTYDAGVDPNGGYNNENVDISFWRVPCSSSGALQPYNGDGGANAITLMRIDRKAENEGRTDHYVLYPDVRIAQGSIAFDDPDGADLVRVARDPNTLIADTVPDSPIYSSQTFVLENYAGTAADLFFNYAFTARVSSLGLVAAETTIDIPDYAPDQTNYPSAFEPLPIDGYATAGWQSADDPLDGLFVTVTESLPDASGNISRLLVFTRLFPDSTGTPFFISGAAAFDYGATSVTINASSLGAGSGSAYGQTPWGTATFTFNSCDDLQIDYAPQTGVPGAAGTVGYHRINLANGLLCE